MSELSPLPQAPALISAALLSPPYSVLSYALPSWLPPCLSKDAWLPGMRILLPLGKGLRVAVVVERGVGTEAPDGLKYALWPLEREPLLDAGYLELARQTGLRHAEPLGRVLGNVLPAPLRVTKGRFRFWTEAGTRDLKAAELAALAGDLRAGAGVGVGSGDGPEALQTLGELWMRGRGAWLEGGNTPEDRELLRLAQDPPWPVRPRAHKQAALLEYLLAHGEVSKRRVLTELGAAAGDTLHTLTGRGLVRVRPLEEGEAGVGAGADGIDSTPPTTVWNASFTLSAAQDAALSAMLADLDTPGQKNRCRPHLLHGVTGSGKTAVYLALAAALLERGRSVMLLAPEVALALKLRRDAENCLKNIPVLLYHGYQSPGERAALFRRVRGGPQALIVGTRSALFLPAGNLGAVILDEEHDASFKQDEGLVYQAKEVAWFRAAQAGALLVLGSATPDVKTFHAAWEGRIRLHSLPERAGGGRVPRIRLVALGKNTGGGLLALESMDALKACVTRGDQAVILLNRRGYSPFVYCLSCAKTIQCPNCAISLTYHKGRERLLCHYCGHSMPFPSPCPDCGGSAFHPMGEGTEKLEESLLPFLPVNTRIVRLDRDSTRRPGRMEEILAAFGRGETQVLVGTQMLSKGHHFPDVTLVVAADADLGLNLPDYRAAERSFQLMLQAAGRAGRGAKAGEVLIQTRDPGHYCWEYVRNSDYEGFFARELALREQRRYPPFVRLALIRMRFPAAWKEGMARVEAVAAAVSRAGRERGVTVLGPAPAPLAMLGGMRRFHCLLKADNWVALREVYGVACRTAGSGGQSRMRINFDPDPLNML